MKETPPLSGRVLSLFVVWMTVFSAMMVVGTVQTPARVKAASLCSQSNVVIGGDWTVAGNELCEGTLFTMTGNLSVSGTLELRDGGIQFAQTPSSTHSVTVTGTLILNHSVITVTGATLDPYLKFSMAVNNPGTLRMIDHSSLKFPGWLNTTGPGATVIVQNSEITGLGGAYAAWSTDANDQYAPVMTLASTSVQLYDSSITGLFEGAADSRRDISLTGSTSFLAVNSFIGIDLDNASAATHNTLSVQGSAQAFLLWPTFTPTSQPSTTWDPPVDTVGGVAYIYRRVNVTAIDKNGVPVDGATLRVTYSGSQTNAQYMDNPPTFATPSPNVLNYLGESASWGTTNAAGESSLPLISDKIDGLGVHFWGNYNISATSAGQTGIVQVSLTHWPVANDLVNQVSVIVQLVGIERPLPDLTPAGVTLNPAHPLENSTTVNVVVSVQNIGLGAARLVDVKVYFNSDSTGLIHAEVVSIIPGSSTVALNSFTWTPPAGSGGNNLIIVWVDKGMTIKELRDDNNRVSYPVYVTPLGPDLSTAVGAMTGFVSNPADLVASITNNGDRTASGVIVSFYEGSLGNLLGTNSSVPTIPVGNTTQVTFTWTPPAAGDYVIYAWARTPTPEQAPYNTTDNIDSNILKVIPSPNPSAYADEIGLVDPYPLNNTLVSLYAVVRNIGQADITTRFNTRFSVDGTMISNDQVPVATMRVGDQSFTQSSQTWRAVGCGFHTLQVDVDSNYDVTEGRIFESDNNVTTSIQVFGDRPPLTYSTDATLQYLSVAQSIIITGHITIVNGSVIVTQPQETCGRVFIKVMNGGSLTLVNSTITARDSANWPLVIYVGGTGNSRFEASQDSKIMLDTSNGEGILEVGANGIISLTDTTVTGDVSAHGLSATFNRVTFKGHSLHTYTRNPTRIWDPVFAGTDYLALRSDDQVKGTMDVDLRNATLDATLTPQLVFGGHQWAQITAVTTTKMTRWWEGAITQDAKVTRCWWLTVQAVDGTGAALQTESHANITLTRLNMQTLAYDPIPQPLLHGDNLFGTRNDSFPAAVPGGILLYKAPAEDRYSDVQKQWMNATYKATGTAVINSTVYAPDTDVIGFVNQSATLLLKFSALTPDLSVTGIAFSGRGSGASQPLGIPVVISATIHNTGKISVSGVKVNFYYTDVVANHLHPGYMDFGNASFSGSYIKTAIITVGANASAFANVTWDQPPGQSGNSLPISVVVDPPISVDPEDGGLIRETNERNNILESTINLEPWPDLRLTTGQIEIPSRLVVGATATYMVTVLNAGTNDATGAYVELRVDGSVTPTQTSAQFNVAKSGSTSTIMTWIPTSEGDHSLNFTAIVAGGISNTDYRTFDNSVTISQHVYGPPDITLVQSDFLYYPSYTDMTQGSTVSLSVKVYNIGTTDAEMLGIGVFMKPATWPPSVLLASKSAVNVSAGQNISVSIVIPWSQSLATGTFQNITIWADYNDAIAESNENNNMANATLRIVLPTGMIIVTRPTRGTTFKPGEVISVTGFVYTLGYDAIPNVPVSAELRDSSNITVLSATTQLSASDGSFTFTIPTQNLKDGDYGIYVSTTQTSLSAAMPVISIKTEQPFTILGLPLWMFLLIIIVIVLVVVGIVAYTRRVGLGKMVECGECGAFIPEDSTKCPKCGVEFEKDMAKCSNCQAWIPLNVKECPECHVQFATGEVEMAGYEQQMRAQYDEVKAKFRESAERELGQALSDGEFDTWWRKQPTFVTFEDWMREAEEMRKMGSRACPTCGTLNSVTATVCHKCGTLMKKEEGGRGAKPPPRGRQEAPRREAAQPAEAPAAAEPRPTEPMPKKVVVKKPLAPTVVQKKVVVKKPAEEQKEGEGGEGSSTEEEI